MGQVTSFTTRRARNRWGGGLAIIANGIAVLPLIRELRGAHLWVTQPWYAGEEGAGGKFPHILAHLRDFLEMGPTRGYFPKPTKIIFVVAPRNGFRAEEFFRGMGLNIVTGSWNLREFIGDGAAEKS